ncbi:7-cyano-7-deazaguanine synthase [Cupriavidus metallidurans]|uniref:7-cyano-7-deazaguanine synthase n=1 Tax=Cupriavidus metallidurans TaxID=119219 RepID=UPI003CFC8B2B
MRSLLLLSGGVDSIAIASWLRPTVSLTINYGQRAAAAEIQASSQVCKELGLAHEVVEVNIAAMGSGRMAGESHSPHSTHEEFWPFRNQFLVTIAGMAAMRHKCDTVLIGTVATDCRHIDGSPEFLATIGTLMQMQEGGIALSAPASRMTTEELVKQSNVPSGVLGWAHSCHSSSLACGHCPGCTKHSAVMQALGVPR